MSTVVAVKKDGIIVIGADTLTKYGDSKQNAELINTYSKIVKAGDNYIAYVGDASFSHILASYFNGIKNVPLLNSPQIIFETARELHKSLKEDYFLNPESEDDDDFEPSRLECLIVNSSGIFGLYSLRSVDEFTKYYSFGTGSRYALGAMHTLYNTDATAEQIARAGLEAAAYFDDSTDSPFEIYTL